MQEIVAHVLVVDQQPEVREIVSLMLSDQGCFRVTSTGSAKEARSIIEQDPPNLAVVDPFLAEESGLSLAQYVAERAVPVVFMTGDHGIAQGLEDHFLPVLRKPFR